MKKPFSEKMMDALDLPKNKSGIITSLSITGVHEAIVEGHKGIIEYTDKTIKINTPQFILKLNGADLEITEIAEEYIAVKGIIVGAEYIF